MIIQSDLEKIIQILPQSINVVLKKHKNKTRLLEIIIDLGRRPEGRFFYGSEYLSERIVSWQDLDYITKRLGNFNNDNRAGIERTLHRISCIRNRQGNIVGLTCRIGRCIIGSIGIIRDLLNTNSSILILGKPGVGKTTLIREISRVLADEVEKRVIIIDTSNEIAGDSDIPHFGIGKARRMQVSLFENQHSVMIEAVENHMPQVIIVDEIGTELEALSVQTIAERGVQLIGTAHGNCLESLIKNPTLTDLIGGIQSVTLSDEEARRRGTQKTVLERKSLPAFQIAIEINNNNFWTIHYKVDESIDLLLQNQEPKLQTRSLSHKNKTKIESTPKKKTINSPWKESSSISMDLKPTKNSKKVLNKVKKSSKIQKPLLRIKHLKKRNKLVIYSIYLSKFQLSHILKSFDFVVYTTKNIQKANVIFISKKYINHTESFLNNIKREKTAIYIV